MKKPNPKKCRSSRRKRGNIMADFIESYVDLKVEKEDGRVYTRKVKKYLSTRPMMDIEKPDIFKTEEEKNASPS